MPVSPWAPTGSSWRVSGANEILESVLLTCADDGFNDSEPRFCGLFVTSHARIIPYFNVLNAQLHSSTITINYVRPKKPDANSQLRLRTLIYPVATTTELAEKWIARLISSAYGSAQRKKRIKVLINPYGGAGKAEAIYNKHIGPLFEAAGCIVDVQKTQHSGHAVEIARDMDVGSFDVLACASGDGLPMECFNGLGQKPNALEALRQIALVQLPCGTGNAMSWNHFGTDEPSVAALCTIKGLRAPMDLASITQGDKRTLSFLSQSLGIVAESDLGTENIRWMGDFRFTFGFLVRLIGQTLYPVDYAVKTEIESKADIKKHYAKEVARIRKSTDTDLLEQQKGLEVSGPGLPPLRHGTVNDPLPKEEDSGWTKLESYSNLGNFYCGNMCWMAADAPFFPASLPNDGLMDLVTIDGDISRLAALNLLLSVSNGTFFDNDFVRTRKISAVRVIPRFGRPMQEVTPQDRVATTGQQTQKPKTGFTSKLFSKIASSGKTGFFSVDGEIMPWEPFQVEIHRGLGTVISRAPGLYQYEGPKGWQDVAVAGELSSETG